MILLISYDLNGYERPSAYEDVKKVIKDNADDYIKPLYSQWFVKTNKSASTWINLLEDVIDKTDRAFVVKVASPHYAGWLTDTQWKWLNENL